MKKGTWKALKKTFMSKEYADSFKKGKKKWKEEVRKGMMTQEMYNALCDHVTKNLEVGK